MVCQIETAHLLTRTHRIWQLDHAFGVFGNLTTLVPCRSKCVSLFLSGPTKRRFPICRTSNYKSATVNAQCALRGADGSIGVRMACVGEGQGKICVRALEARAEQDFDPDSRDVVLGRKRKSGCLSTSHPVTNPSTCDQKTNPSTCDKEPILHLLTYPNFAPLPASYKPVWVSLFHRLRNRADTVLRLLNQHGSRLGAILTANKVDWAQRCALYTTFRKPHKSVKLFFRPSAPIACEFLVKGEPTQGVMEGVEILSDKPMMRVHLSYPSWERAKQLQQLKMALVRGAPTLTNGDHLREIWSLAFPHPKVSQGHEFVSRLIRFGPSARKKNGRKSSWPFHGVYTTLVPMKDRELATVHFMVKYARRDRSVNQIKVSPSLKSGIKCALDVF